MSIGGGSPISRIENKLRLSNTTSTQNNIKEAIVLAGGLGTRLSSALPDLPKCLAPVSGRPFLFYVIRYLRSQGIERIVFSLGYRHEMIERYLHDEFAALDYDCAIESEPLGTGGAIRLAATHCQTAQVLVVNGDTFFEAGIAELANLHSQSGASCSLALKPMQNFDRYGLVEVDNNGFIKAFREKQKTVSGLINGGVYLLNREAFLAADMPVKFSFEKDFLEPQAAKGTIAGLAHDAYFIDIGIPEDLNRAQSELKRPPLSLDAIDPDWSLFLDRDGVINVDKPGSYIFHPDEFRFMPGAPELFRRLKEKFRFTFVVTNQRGVGRQLMTEEMLQRINANMCQEIEAAGGKIDRVYYATALSDKDPVRKPNPGMAVQARREFRDIHPDKCLMIGNNVSDMQFGRNAGMYTVFLTTTNKDISLPHPDIDMIFEDLAQFVKAL